MKKVFKIVVILVLFVLVIGGGAMFYITRGLDTIEDLTINSCDLTSLEDGLYTGKFEMGRFSNEIDVEVKENSITSITLVEDVRFARPDITEELFSKIMETQNTNVDITSGATVTSKAYLKAIENALSAN